LQSYGVSTEGLNEEQQQNALEAAMNFGQFFYQNYGSQYGFTSPRDAFKKLTGGNISIVFDTSRKTGCETTINTIVCAADALNMKTFVHEYVHVMDNYYSIRSTNDEHCANETGYGCLASNYFPQEYFNDPKYAYEPYLCNRTDCISHPNKPEYGAYTTAEAYANYMENVILSGLGIDPLHNGFNNTSYSNDLHTWMQSGYGNIYTILDTIVP
jgi:hypothetical protein